MNKRSPSGKVAQSLSKIGAHKVKVATQPAPAPKKPAQAKPKRVGNYPTKKTEPNIRAILEGIASGKSLMRALEPVSVGYSTFMEWLEDDKKLAERYTRAREDQADYLADQILDIADDSMGDMIERGKETQLNSENIQRSRLRVEARKWIAAKLKPKKYGDKLGIGAADGLDQVVVRVKDFTGKA